MTSWTYLIIGSFGAVGAAMTVGTLAALLRHRRTGTFPGHDEPVELSRRQLIGMWVRVAVGGAVAVAAYASLSNAGLL